MSALFFLVHTNKSIRNLVRASKYYWQNYALLICKLFVQLIGCSVPLILLNFFRFLLIFMCLSKNFLIKNINF
uniref:Uncharacterized protein n=1 Tax=Meloidogyne enterolobii TaxID=390850 RepID=A0A6V7VIV6_MELEN|nr:unnamed protein product [Meloidogyne enterolobii]